MRSRQIEATARPTRVHIPFDLPLGDLVVFGGVLRELHRCHPGEFEVTVESSITEFWTHCPHARLGTSEDKGIGGPANEVTDLYLRALRHANFRPRHMLQSLVDELNLQLGTRVEVGQFRGEAWLPSEYFEAPGPVELALGRPAPYWIVCNGGKFDRTVKWWPNEYYQKVVDSFRDRLLFVQVGRIWDYHPRLEGTLDFRAGTDIATLLRLVYWAEGVVCPITSLMHLAAAVPRSPGRAATIRPCVVVGGGIEPAHLTAYPGHRFLSTVGALSCTGDGCWKSRTVALGDGNPADAPEGLCEAVEELSPRCMRMIQPAEVSNAVQSFVAGGAARELSPEEVEAARQSVGLVCGTAQDETYFTRQTARLAIERQVKLFRGRRLGGNGRGLVTLAAGIDYTASAWVMVGLHRSLGFSLPIEVWIMEDDRAQLRILRKAFARFDARIRCHKRTVDPRRPRCSLFASKPEVIVASAFREVLWVDADSFPVRDPSYLFELAEYRDCGAVFWPDIEGFQSTTPDAWKAFGLPEDATTSEVQGGELLINKCQAAPALLLARWCNQQYGHLYSFLYSDKDVFRLAFRKMGQSYAMPAHPPKLIDGCLFPTDFTGKGTFQHRVAAKIKVGSPLASVRGFEHHDRCQELLDTFTEQIAPLLAEVPAAVPEAAQRTPVELQVV